MKKISIANLIYQVNIHTLYPHIICLYFYHLSHYYLVIFTISYNPCKGITLVQIPKINLSCLIRYIILFNK